MRILVVDDSAMMRKIIRKELESGGYEIYEAIDGVDALEKIPDIQPHLITLDVDMPNMNGFEAAYRIRSDLTPLTTEIEHKVPIIFITANDSINGRLKGFEAGATDFITKPFGQGDVLRAVDAQLKPKPIFQGLTALIAEDSQLTRHVLDNILRAEGMQTILTCDGEEALESLKGMLGKIDLVITDYMMPKMNGDELCHKIRTELGETTLPIIFLSGMSERSSILDMFRAGASDYVIKPFAKEELLARVKVHLESRILHKRLRSRVNELRRFNELQKDFLAVTSHDLRSPLNGIMGFTQLVLNEAPLDQTHSGYLKHVLESGHFLQEMINDILELSRAQSRKDNLQMERESITDILNSCVDTLQHMASPKRISLELLNKCNHSPYVRGNKSALIRIFTNIISNAIKFTPKGGSITQVLEQSDAKHLSISIMDSGIGIPQDQIPHLFNKFTKTSRIGTIGELGTGLGLSITKELVERHHGQIEVFSEEGKGTCFRLTLPLDVSIPLEKKRISPSFTPETRKKTKDFHILLVDDNILNIKITKTILEAYKYRVSVVKNGENSVVFYTGSLHPEMPSSERIDLILMDLYMPVMDGFEATTQIRNFEKEQHQPPVTIIGMIGQETKETKDRCKLVGMNDFLEKPLRTPLLKEIIQKYTLMLP